MKRQHALIAAALLAVALALPSPAAAQGGRPGPGRAGVPLYDTATVQTLTGTVVSIDTIAGPRALGGGIHLQLRTGSETIPVHLGPAWYMNQERVRLAAGDRITVRGSRIDYQGAPVLVAAELTRDRDRAVVRLRDGRGIPAWTRGAQQGGRGRRVP